MREGGHIAANCPSMPLMYPDGQYGGRRVEPSNLTQSLLNKGLGITRCGEVEGTPVTDITVDTGSARTIINSNLVSDSTTISREIRCARGDVLVYPLAQVEIRIGEKCFMVEAAVSKTLPMSVLLGRDAPDLLDLINTPIEVDDSLVAMTRAS